MKILFSQKTEDISAYFVYSDGSVLGCASPDEALKKTLAYAKSCESFSGERSSSFCLDDSSTGKRTILVGLGNPKDFNMEILRRSVNELTHLAEKRRIASISLPLMSFDCSNTNEIVAITETAVMSSYRYIEYLTSPKAKYLNEVALVVNPTQAMEAALNRGIVLGEAVCRARDLVNEPANVQTPLKLAEEAVALGEEYGFSTRLLDEKEIIALGMEAFYNVGMASHNPSVLIVMDYKGATDSKEKIGLVGKGVTYDSGGLNLKSGDRFITMKHDMAGAATVISTLCAASRLKLPVNLVVIVAACENVISSTAFKPGDIIGSMDGKTIQITSTDAEGRLTMIDALTYAATIEGATCLIDIATLTGAARRMFGDYAAPYVSTCDDLSKAVDSGAKEAGEVLVRLPIIEEIKDVLRCDVADMVNSARSEVGGMISASLFIREFTCGLPWLHIDASGPLWIEKDVHYMTKGGSGWGVRTLFHAIENLSKAE